MATWFWTRRGTEMSKLGESVYLVLVTALENDRALAYGLISRNALDGGVHVGDLHRQAGLSPNLVVNIHGPALQRSMAELSRRRKKAIKAAFRRIDRGQGWVSLQEFTRTLQQLSHLGHLDQQRVIHAICGGVGSRVTYSQFSWILPATELRHPARSRL